ncbi:MAG: hypothetical protein ACREOM_00755 [Candidatus Dormibacteraceae bacterium]
MNALMIGVYAATAVIGLWELVSGRRIPDRSPQGVRRPVLRIVGAATLVGCLVALFLAATGDQGFGFIAFGATALAVWTFTSAASRPKAIS